MLAHANYTQSLSKRNYMWTFYERIAVVGSSYNLLRLWINYWEKFPQCPEDSTMASHIMLETRRPVFEPMAKDYIILSCDVGKCA